MITAAALRLGGAGDEVGDRFRLGDRVGPFRIVQRIGAGGMGVVWKAVDAEERPVALKFISESLLATDSQDRHDSILRFEQEARILVDLRHKNVVAGRGLIHLETVHLREPVLVMEFLEGRSLAEYRGRLDVGESLRLVAQALEGLAAVHAAGLVHRDIKLENLLEVRESDGSATVKLIDFGIVFKQRALALTHKTVTLGTVSHVAPEVFRSKDNCGPRSDVWAMGVALFDLLTGDVPYPLLPGEEHVGYAVRMANQRPRLNFGPRTEIKSGVKGVVRKALAVDPAARFASASEFRIALMRAAPTLTRVRAGVAPITHFDATNPAPSSGDLAARRYRLAFQIAGVVLVALLVVALAAVPLLLLQQPGPRRTTTAASPPYAPPSARLATATAPRAYDNVVRTDPAAPPTSATPDAAPEASDATPAVPGVETPAQTTTPVSRGERPCEEERTIQNLEGMRNAKTATAKQLTQLKAACSRCLTRATPGGDLAKRYARCFNDASTAIPAPTLLPSGP